MEFSQIFEIIQMGIAAFFLYTGYVTFMKHYKMNQLIKKTETKNIEDINSDGLYEVNGRVECEVDMLESPLSKKPCVYYKIEVQELERRGKSRSWETILEEEKNVEFLVNDGTGKASVNLKGAEVTFKKDREESSGMFESLSQEAKDFLEQRTIESKGWIFDKTLKIIEQYLQEYDKIYVLGDIKYLSSDEIAFQKKENFLIVSDYSESELSITNVNQLLIWGGIFILALGFLSYKLYFILRFFDLPLLFR